MRIEVGPWKEQQFFPEFVSDFRRAAPTRGLKLDTALAALCKKVLLKPHSDNRTAYD